ncbi:unnamed protein product [Closterium sp. NIES-54]
MQLQRRPRESLTPQQLREWYASWGCGGSRRSCRPRAGQLGASGGGRLQLQPRPCETLTSQQLHEWYAQSRGSLSTVRCPYVIRTGDRTGHTCGTLSHTQSRCFARLSDAWRTEFGDEAKLPDWVELLGQRVDIFALDYYAILTAMYAFSVSAEGDCYLCVPPDPGITPGIAPAALGACESAPLGTAPAQALHTFTLDCGASRCFFRDSTTVTPLPAPVPVSLADPSWGPVLARSSTVLPCSAVPSGELSGLHLPSFSTNLVSDAVLQDAGVDTFTPGHQRVAICTCSQTDRHLATFARAPGSNLYTLTTASRSTPLSPQLHASAQVATQCECRRLSHDTLLWHHRLGHPSLPRLRSMHSRLLDSGLPRSLPPLPLSPAPPCIPCVEGRQRAAPHSSSFPPTKAPLQTLHLDIRATCLQLRERFQSDFPILRPHSDRGGEFSSDLLAAFCAEHGIRQTFTLLASPQQNGVAEPRIGLVMEVARTSMIHAAAPHFLWPFAVRYAAHQLNLWPRVSLPETSPTLLWTGKVGDASRFWVWGARAFVRDTIADKLSPRAIPCVFVGFVPDAPGWQFYDPASRCVFASQHVTFDESVSFYCLFPYRTAPPPPPPPPFSPQVDPPAPAPVEVTGDSGPAASGAVPGGAELGGAESGGAEHEEPGGAASGGVASGGAEPVCAEPGGAESGGESPEGSATAFPRSPWSRRLCPRVPLTSQQLHDWYGRRQRRASAPQGSTAGGSSAGVAGPGGARTEGTGAAGAGGVVTEGTGAAKGAGAAGGTGAAGGAGGAGAAEGTGATSVAGAAEGTGGARPAEGPGATDGAGAARGAGAAGGAGATSAGGTAQQRLLFAPPSPSSQPPPDSALRQVLSLPLSIGLPLQPGSPLPAPSPHTEQTRGLAERREPALLPVSPVRSGRSGRRVPRQRQPAVSGPPLVVRHPSSPPMRVPLPSPPTSSLPVVADPASDQVRAEHSTVTRLLATVVTDPSFESATASALVAELVDFAAACRLDYAASLVAESESVHPPSVRGECALGTDVLEDRQEDLECLAAAAPHLVSMLLAPEGDSNAPDIPTPRSYAEAIAGEYSSQWQTAMDAEMASWKSTGTYVDEVPPPGANIVNGMWIFRVKRPPGSPPVFKARLHEEIWLRRPPGFTGSFPPGTQWSLRRPVYGLRQAPREWHDTLRSTLAALGFAPSTADPSLFLRTDTSLPPFYVLVYVDDLVFATADTEALALVKSELQKRHTCTDLAQATPLATGHSLSAPPSDESVEPSGPYPELVGCLMYLMTCTRPDLAYPLVLLARYVAPGRHRKVHMDAAKRVLRYLCNTSGMGLVLGGQGDVVLTGHSDASWAEIYATAMAAQEMRWLTYLLTDLGERPRSPPVLYVDNKAAIALCQEHRLEHRTKHIALRYFLARELQQCGQLRLTYVATRANIADIFTKALLPALQGNTHGITWVTPSLLAASAPSSSSSAPRPARRPTTAVRAGRGISHVDGLDPEEFKNARITVTDDGIIFSMVDDGEADREDEVPEEVWEREEGTEGEERSVVGGVEEEGRDEGVSWEDETEEDEDDGGEAAAGVMKEAQRVMEEAAKLLSVAERPVVDVAVSDDEEEDVGEAEEDNEVEEEEAEEVVDEGEAEEEEEAEGEAVMETEEQVGAQDSTREVKASEEEEALIYDPPPPVDLGVGLEGMPGATAAGSSPVADGGYGAEGERNSGGEVEALEEALIYDPPPPVDLGVELEVTLGDANAAGTSLVADSSYGAGDGFNADVSSVGDVSYGADVTYGADVSYGADVTYSADVSYSTDVSYGADASYSTGSSYSAGINTSLGSSTFGSSNFGSSSTGGGTEVDLEEEERRVAERLKALAGMAVGGEVGIAVGGEEIIAGVERERVAAVGDVGMGGTGEEAVVGLEKLRREEAVGWQEAEQAARMEEMRLREESEAAAVAAQQQREAVAGGEAEPAAAAAAAAAAASAEAAAAVALAAEAAAAAAASAAQRGRELDKAAAKEREAAVREMRGGNRQEKLQALQAEHEFVTAKMFFYPEAGQVRAGETVEIFFHRPASALKEKAGIFVVGAFNEWQWEPFKYELTPSNEVANDWWTCSVTIPKEAYQMNFVFHSSDNVYENNEGRDFYISIDGGMVEDEFERFLNEQKQREAEERTAEEAERERKAEEERRAALLRAQQEEERATAQAVADEARQRLGPIWESAGAGEEGVWRLEVKEGAEGEVERGLVVRVDYNRAGRPLAGAGEVWLHAGVNGWQGGVTVVEKLERVNNEDGDWWAVEVSLPQDAVALNWVFADGPVGKAGAWDNNSRRDFAGRIGDAMRIEALFEGMAAECLQRLEQEREERDAKEAEEAARRAEIKAAMKARTKAVFLQSQAHVFFTEPAEPRAGEAVRVYYNPSGTALQGREKVWMRGSFNRWTHRSGCFLPIHMLPAENGTHLVAEVPVPQDAYILDLVFMDSSDPSTATYDNRGGLDYHVPVAGSTVREPPLYIVHVALEMAPVAKVGGLGDVVTSLSRATIELGHRVEVVLPKYDCLKYDQVQGLEAKGDFVWGGTRWLVWHGRVEGIPVNFLEPESGLFWVGCIYGRKDDAARFGTFCHAALEFLLQTGRSPDLLHCHDWSSAPVAWLQREQYSGYGGGNARTVFTIHNLEFGQDMIGRAMAACDMATTVSPTYAAEISGHAAVAAHRAKFHGILNGIDPDLWDPMGDPFLPMKYSAVEVVEGKQAAKAELRARLNLRSFSPSEDRPLVGIVTRLTAQKGIALIKHALWRTLERGGQVVLLGSAPDGRVQGEFEALARDLGRSHGDMARLWLSYDEPLSHLMYAASDMILVPSIFEPCGLTQLVAMRYGAVPVVRKTGGLRDTVMDVDSEEDRQRAAERGMEPNGFSFEGADAAGVDYALNRWAASGWESCVCALVGVILVSVGSVAVRPVGMLLGGMRVAGGLRDMVIDVDSEEDRQRATERGMEPNGFSFEGADAAGVDYALNSVKAGMHAAVLLELHQAERGESWSELDVDPPRS